MELHHDILLIKHQDFLHVNLHHHPHQMKINPNSDNHHFLRQVDFLLYFKTIYSILFFFLYSSATKNQSCTATTSSTTLFFNE